MKVRTVLSNLLIVGEWMPITIFLTKNGKLINGTDQFFESDLNGFWSSVLVEDLNKDGKQDIIAGNIGENFKWKASEETPVKMYLDDFDNNKQLDQLIFYTYFGTYVPFASKDKLVQQLPILKKKFLNYTAFSKVNTIVDLTQREEKSILETKYLYELRSMLYINKGKSFTPQALPKETQLSTIEDFYIEDDKILYTGNYEGFVTELGKSTSNSGGLLLHSNDTLIEKSSLKLPKDFYGRKIVKLKENNYLILSNNGKSYIVTTKDL